MSDSSPQGFGSFLPGWDFLQGLTRGAAAAGAGAAQPQGLASWLTPTLSVEELDKRIQELRTVQFWLDQNANALKAAIQALEVQRMTLVTLQGLNLGGQPSAAPPQADAPTSAQGANDPLAWWNTLTQQFQQIASSALQDGAAQAAMRQAGEMAQQAMQAAGPAAAPATAKPAAPARKTRKPSTARKRGGPAGS